MAAGEPMTLPTVRREPVREALRELLDAEAAYAGVGCRRWAAPDEKRAAMERLLAAREQAERVLEEAR